MHPKINLVIKKPVVLAADEEAPCVRWRNTFTFYVCQLFL